MSFWMRRTIAATCGRHRFVKAMVGSFTNDAYASSSPAPHLQNSEFSKICDPNLLKILPGCTQFLRRTNTTDRQDPKPCKMSSSDGSRQNVLDTGHFRNVMSTRFLLWGPLSGKKDLAKRPRLGLRFRRR